MKGKSQKQNFNSDKDQNKANENCNKSTNGKRRKRRTSSPKKDDGYMTSLEQPNVVTEGNKDNDPKWYMNLDNIAKDYASLPMSQVLGLASYNWERFTGAYSSTGAPFRAYGLMTLKFLPTIGANDDGATAPVNLAAQQIYTLIRQANSGAKNYDKTDVMMVILAMDSAYMLYEDLLRAYRVMSTYSSVNRYYPNGILQALGFDPSISNNIAQLRGLLDTFAYKLASINIPDQIDLIKRHSWMCSNIYLDDDSNKAQSYAFVPRTIYQWVEGVADNPTHLSPIILHREGSQLKVEDVVLLIDTIMNPIMGSEDIGVITGDMMKAFGEAGMIKIRPVEDYAALVPVYSKEVLMQIRNTFSAPEVNTSTPGATGDIHQVLTSTINGPYLEQKLSCNPGADGGRRIASTPILNFIDEDATPENVMVATRLISVMNPTGSGGISTFKWYGTEVIVKMNIWIYDSTNVMTGYAIDQDLYFSTTMSQSNLTANAFRIQGLSHFNNAPSQYLYAKDTIDTETRPQYIGATANLCNYIFLDDETLKNLHQTATMSLFTVKDYKMNF